MVTQWPAWTITGKYIPAEFREEFDAFRKVLGAGSARNTEADSLRYRIDEALVQDWIKNVVDAGRLEGQHDPHKRVEQLDKEGIAAEVLFPDFGRPFELDPSHVAALKGTGPTPPQVEIANKAHNRWLADFCKEVPNRFGGLAVCSFADIDDTVAELKSAREAGLIGVVLPAVDEDLPFFHPRYEPIWSALEDLDMSAHTHASISSITKNFATGILKAIPHPACLIPIYTPYSHFHCTQILTHLIWGGVLERHPRLKLVPTEQGSGWVVPALRAMDYSWEGSYLRRDVREIVKMKPSDYYRRQVYIGASLFSMAEMEARNVIGVDKICIGMDYPHHEGTWGTGPGTVKYLQATLGAAHVPAQDAVQMLGGNAVQAFGFNSEALQAVADRIAPTIGEILTPPTTDEFPRGDVHKPL
jgi:predicted TIM-barrel fold metal-dependent hydrolase